MRSSLIRPSFWPLGSLRYLLGPATLLVCLLILGWPTDAVAETCSATDAAVKDIAGTKVVAGDHNDIVDDCTTLLGLKDTLRGTGSLNWATTLAMTAWDGIKTDDRGEISGNPPRVTKLNLGAEGLTGTVPSNLSKLTGLTRLSLGYNQLTGTIPPELGNLTGLYHLGLRDNRLTGSIPTQLGNLTGLGYLYLSENQLTGTIPDLSKMTGLDQLYLGNNSFTSGGIPAWVTKLTRLSHLHLHNTNRTGALPDLSALTGLESLKLPNNSLTAPSSWTWLASLDDLWMLDLSHNSLSGTIPTQIGSLTDLSILYLNDNQLTGTIPDLSKLTRLTYLKLNNNSLTTPTSWTWLASLTKLVDLRLSHNSLSGTIPTQVKDLPLYTFYATSNTTLCLPQSLKSWHKGVLFEDVLLLCPSNDAVTFRQRSAISAVTVEMSGGSYALKSGYPKPALPSGLSFDSTTNTLSGTPDTAQEQTAYTFEFHNSQKTAEFVRLVLNITVTANAVPAFGNNTIADLTYTTGQSVSYNFPQASGGDAPLTYTLSPALPTGLTFNATARPPTLSGTPSATAPSTAYTYTVTDKDGDTASLSFSLTVNAPPAPSPGVTITPTTLTVAENAGTATYTVVLDSQPTATVTITPTSSATIAATVSGALTFTTTNWNTAQTVTVTGVDDDIDGDRSTTISHTVSNTGGYTNVAAASVAVTLTDDDTRGVTVSTSTLTVAENAGTATYTVVLDSQPTATVTVTPTSSATAEATVSGALTFTHENWDTAQTVTVTGVDDDIDSDRSTTITHTVSNTGGYTNVAAASVAVTLTDDDTRGVTVSTSTLTVAENGGTATYTVVLDSQPTANVTVTPASSNTSAATVSGALTFTDETWNTAQTVTVTGVNDDTIAPAGQTATITHTVSNTGGYGSVPAASVTVTLADDDAVTVTPTTLTVAENGGTATYTVVLNKAPTANVTVTPASSATAEATVSGALTFTGKNWNTPQTVTVTGVNDAAIAPAGHAATISHTVSQTGGYTNVTAPDVAVTLPDDDAVTITPTTLTVAENGGTATYTVVLNKAPTANVTVTPASANSTFATVSGALTFTADDWDTAQPVTVTGVNDDINSVRRVTISHTVSTTGGYTNVTAPDVAVTLPDDDTTSGTLDGGTPGDGSSGGGGGGGGGAGAAGDQHGDTPALATQGAVGSSIPGEINAPIDQDYFAIAVPQAGLLVVETSGTTDTQGSLATPDGQVLAQADSGGAQQNFQVRQRVAAGDYLVAVSGTEPGSYRLEVDLLVGFVDNPQPASAQSGIGVLSGWVCEAETVEVELNGVLQEAAYGTERTDTHRDCGDTNNGFGLLYNWNKLGDGEHTVRILVDGIAFATPPVTVTTLGLDTEFPTGLTGEATLMDFPTDGESMRLVWQEAQQNFALAEGPVTQRGTTRDWTWAVLENPAPGSYQSGIRVISGWVCEAEEVVVEIGDAHRLVAAYGTERADTEEHCGDTNNGFGVLWNWNKLADGAHTMRLVVDGEEWATAEFVVTTLGEEFRRGLAHTATVADFPTPGQAVTVEWQEAQQNFVMTGVE